MSHSTWKNWSHSVKAAPQNILVPSSENKLIEAVKKGNRNRSMIRAAGSGHSFVPLCATDGLIISLDNLQGVVEIDSTKHEATVWAGSKIYQLGEPLLAAGFAMENMGDIDRQSIAGAIGTGTHGTGKGIGSISTQVVGLRLITAEGEILQLPAEKDKSLFKAAQVSFGALGIVSQVTLRLLPAYRLHERTWIEPFESCFEQLSEHIDATRHFEFFWSPAEDRCACKSLQPTKATHLEVQPNDQQVSGRLSRYVQEERIDYSHRIFPSERNILFNELEFAVPAGNGPECLLAIRQLMQQKHPEVMWPIEYRTLAADDIWLSPAYHRDTVTISIHQAADLPHQDFFADAEEIFREFDGRPHWGKMHSYTAEDLRQLYPMWNQFQQVRQKIDPTGRFLNPYLQKLFGVDSS